METYHTEDGSMEPASCLSLFARQSAIPHSGRLEGLMRENAVDSVASAGILINKVPTHYTT